MERTGPMRILVVVPTYDERENVARLVPRILEVDPRLDVLVVDDNSPDGTGEIADGLAGAEPRMHVLHRHGKEGLGKAYLAGFRWALERDYDYVLQMDADFSHRPEDVGAFLRAVDAGREVVVGSRYVDGRVTVINWPMSRLLVSYFGCWYARTITGLRIRDATGGFNCWSARVLRGIDLDAIESNGYSFQIELKFRAWKMGFDLEEIPIVFSERDSGDSKMSKAIVREAVWRVWRLRLLALTGRL